MKFVYICDRMKEQCKNQRGCNEECTMTFDKEHSLNFSNKIITSAEDLVVNFSVEVVSGEIYCTERPDDEKETIREALWNMYGTIVE